MASKDFPHSKKKASLPLSSILLLAVLAFVTLFLLFNHSSSSYDFKSRFGGGACDYAQGKWIYDPDAKPKYDNTCKEIFKGWNCVSGNKKNSWEIVKWRWKPEFCDLKPFDPLKFLERFRNTNIGMPA